LPHIRLVSVLAVLDKLGYIPLPSKAERIFSESIKKCFERLFGQAATTIILNNLSSLYGLSEKELTTNYDIFAKSLYTLSGYGAKIILAYIKEEMLVKAVALSLVSEITEQDIVNPDIEVGHILKKIGYSEILEFVRRTQAGMHTVFVYENENTKHKILDAFLGESYRRSNHSNTATLRNSIGNVTSIIRALISNKQTKFSHINNILYYEDLIYFEKSELLSKISDWINSFKDENNREVLKKFNNEEETITDDSIISPSPSSPQIRMAIEDLSWFLTNRFRLEFVMVEEMLKKYIRNSKPTSILCVYKKSKIFGSEDDINEEMIMRMVKSHSCLILEDPPIIYAATKL
jgi:hypothetical protein